MPMNQRNSRSCMGEQSAELRESWQRGPNEITGFIRAARKDLSVSRQKPLLASLGSLFGSSMVRLVAALSLALWASDSAAYEFYSDDTNDQGGCAQCHTGFKDKRSYTSVAEDFDWDLNLHDTHLSSTDIDSSCLNCHRALGEFGRTVNTSSSANAKDGVNAISCMGCHGRLDDANGFGPGMGSRSALASHQCRRATRQLG